MSRSDSTTLLVVRTMSGSSCAAGARCLATGIAARTARRPIFDVRDSRSSAGIAALESGWTSPSRELTAGAAALSWLTAGRASRAKLPSRRADGSSSASSGGSRRIDSSRSSRRLAVAWVTLFRWVMKPCT